MGEVRLYKYLLSWLFVVCFMICFSFSVKALPRFEADISVDVTAKTVTEAKNKAVSQAIREGIGEIVSGISTESSVEEINKLNDNQLEHFITGVMVLMEKTSDVRYIADLRIGVDENLLKAYMAENNMPIVLAEDREIVVIPVLEKGDGNLILWEDDNVWRQAFLGKKSLRKGNIELKLIEKNLGNIAMIKTNRVYDLVDGEYQELAKFNQADAMYVLKYSLKDGKLYAKAYPSKDEKVLDIGDATPEIMVDKVFSLIKAEKKVASTEEAGLSQPKQIDVVYSYTRLSEWMSLKQLLEDNTQVQDIKIISMANSKVHFSFLFSGVIERLQGSLATKGYKMKEEGEYYVIY